MEQKVAQLLAEGVIQESHSPWNSPLFLASKKDGSYRLVIDFRKVSALTVPDQYPLPIFSDLLQYLGDSNTVFSSINHISGFWQIPLDAKSREITAFSRLLATMDVFASTWGCEMGHLPFREWSIPSFQASSGTVCFLTFMTSFLSQKT